MSWEPDLSLGTFQCLGIIVLPSAGVLTKHLLLTVPDAKEQDNFKAVFN